MPRFTRSCLVAVLSAACCAAASHQVHSPDGDLVVTVTETAAGLELSASHEGTPILTGAPVAMDLIDNARLPMPGTAFEAHVEEVERTVEPIVRHKSATIADHYHRLLLSSPTLDLEVRVFDDGFGYRFTTRLEGRLQIKSEHLPLQFPAGTRSYFPEEESLMSHNECLYLDLPLAEIGPERFASTPLLCTTPEGVRILVTDADLFDYPGLFVSGTGSDALTALHPPYPLQIEPDTDRRPDRDVRFAEIADYIADTEGHRNFPWRVFVVTRNDGELVENQLVHLLSRETTLTDTSWIKPGKVAWDWFHARVLRDVDFVSGFNNATYKVYIDFAAEYGVEYIILDEGWSASTTNLFEFAPEIDVPELVAYGEERGVGVILWALNEPLSRDLDVLMEQFAAWGVKGLKIDFMQRNDQRMVEFYEEAARAAADHHLLIDYHGAYKPSGLRRAYPNVMTYEGVKAAEYNKWYSDITPRHNLTIPFIRMAVGPMDYTPGCLSNEHVRYHKPNYMRPMTIGTRAHEIAKFVVYESALQMLSDSPSNYRDEPEVTRFIAAIPSVWDETRVISGQLSEHLLIARRSGDTWYVGGMTNEDAREFELPLDFLSPGTYTARILQDGVNVDRHAEDHRIFDRTVAATDILAVPMAANGGWAAIISR